MNNDNNDPIATGPQSQHSKNPQSFQTLISAPNQDFHFFNNIQNFTLPVDRIVKTSDSWNNAINLADDWIADLNDAILEQFGIPMDDIEQQTGNVIGSYQDNNVFQLVQGKKKKKGSSEVVVTTTKPKVPFHIPTIRKPQEEYNILVDNSYKPFEHVWLQRSRDGLRFIHPLEKLNVMKFVDKNIAYNEPIIPSLIESTRSKLVEKVKDLKELAAKLRYVDEFAVDLEHNQYRSFQGLTCLMQISTRIEDFIVDTLKLRIHIGPYLREVFKDPKKRKVMHGADKDILWLQRDFDIYLCNLFDTGQASRVLKLERNSLEHLLQHYCGITANKEYQNADWRLRPLPVEMLRYAREDTHYLLYIYDLMREKLLKMPKEPEHCDAPLEEVYKRSADICMQLYEKELLMENSYLHIYGLQGASFNAEQLAIVAALCQWRDRIARSEDESTGYVLPNKVLLEIAKQMPVTTSKLHRLLKSKHPYVEQNLGAVVSIIKHSLQNAVAYEAAAQQLRMERVVNASEEQAAVNKGVEALPPETPTDSNIANDRTKIIDGDMGRLDRIKAHPASPQHGGALLKFGSSISGLDMVKQQTKFPFDPDLNGMSMFSRESFAISGQSGEANACPVIPPSAKIAAGATISVLKKPSCTFGTLDEMEKEDVKLEQIRSSVNLSFHSNSGTNEQPKPETKEPTRLPEVSRPEELPTEATELTSENIIMLEDNSNKNETINGNSSLEDETMSLSELCTGFQQCFQSINEQRNVVEVKKSKEPNNVLQMKPFDYEAAMKEVTFGTVHAGKGSGRHSNSAGKKKSSAIDRLQIDDGNKQFSQARQRVAFPASGNRSATFR